jgi:hypothetical protein
MTDKHIVVSAHALERMAERGITLDMVRQVIASGEPFEGVVTRPGAALRIGRRLAFGDRILRAIWFEEGGALHLITAMWQYD